MYHRMYITLFSAISAALETLPKSDCTAAARLCLEEGQQKAEEILINWELRDSEPEGEPL